MAKFLHQNVLDQGLQYIITRAGSSNVDMLLLSSYTQGQAYATVNANKLAAIDLGSGDFSLGANGTYGRQLNVAAKSGTATAAAAIPDLHIAIVDVTSALVLAVTDETSDQAITVGRAFNVPAFSIRMGQPV